MPATSSQTSLAGQESKEPVDPFAELESRDSQIQESSVAKEVPLKVARPEEPGKVEVEKSVEQELSALEKEVAQEEEKGRRAVATAPAKVAEPVPVVSPKTAVQEEIEDILEENLTDIYQKMDEEHKKLFREKGEETVGKIAALIASAKATARKIASLIIEWLRIIPGVNRFFLEQEAKIKADRILAINKNKT